MLRTSLWMALTWVPLVSAQVTVPLTMQQPTQATQQYSAQQSSAQPSVSCNGAPEFCDLQYNQYTNAATYQSFSYDLTGDCNASPIDGNTTLCSTFFTTFDCYYENQGGRDVIRQLEDGIREFDVQTCTVVANNNPYAAACQIINGTDAVGDDVDTIFSNMATYLQYYPNQIVTMEFSLTENATAEAPYIVDRLAFRFGSMLLPAPATTLWPTLGQMVQMNQRVVTFFSLALLQALSSPPPWVLARAQYYYPSQLYTVPALPVPVTDNATQALTAAQQVPGLIQSFCAHPDVAAVMNRWLCLDFEFPQLIVCPSRVSNIINQQVDAVALSCLIETYFHRVRVNNYYIGVELARLVYRVNLSRWMMLQQNLLPSNLLAP